MLLTELVLHNTFAMLIFRYTEKCLYGQHDDVASSEKQITAGQVFLDLSGQNVFFFFIYI